MLTVVSRKKDLNPMGMGAETSSKEQSVCFIFMSFSGLFPDHPSSWVMLNVVQICPPLGFR